MKDSYWTTLLFALVIGSSIGLKLLGPVPPPDPLDRTVNTVTVPASVADVWAAYTTKEGLESWKAAVAELDLRPGGFIRTTDDGSSGLAGPETVEKEVLSVDPGRMLSTRFRKVPANFPYPRAVAGIWHVSYFEATGAKETVVTTRGLGYTNDPESQKLREHFARANAESLAALRLKFAKKSGSGSSDSVDASSSSGD